MAGYSGTPLVKKLGIKAGYTIFIHDPPSAYFEWLGPLPEGIIVKERVTVQVDFVHLFVQDKSAFEKEFVRCRKKLKAKGMLWVSWPKKSSKVPTDLNENLIRDFGLKEGLVDVKVCAIDDVWSALKFVYRLKDRKQ
jgi:hypothetical protein